MRTFRYALGLPAKAQAGAREREQHAEHGDRHDVQAESSEVVVTQPGNHAQLCVHGECSRGGEEEKLESHHAGKWTGGEPSGRGAKQVVGKPQAGDDLHCERRQAAAVIVLLKVANEGRLPFAERAGQHTGGEDEVTADPDTGTEHVDGQE